MTPAARFAAAITLLEAIEQDRRPADAVANQFFRERRFIGSGDRRAVSEQVWGVLRARRRLTWWLERIGATPTPRLMAAAAAILGGDDPIAIGRLFSGGRFAPSPLTAAETSTLGRLKGHTIEHPHMSEAVRLEMPDWILPRLAERFGPSLEAELRAMLAPAPLDLRVNLLCGSREHAIQALAAEGIAAQPTRLSPWGLRVAGRRPVTSGAAFRSGLVEIQDEGSQCVALLADTRPGQRVADLCAGAGGKTLAMAMAMENRGQILACDVSEPRLDAAVRRLRRAGVHNVERLLLTPGEKRLKRLAGAFDRVLVDAPCTGTGTWRRNPDARHRLREDDLRALLLKQKEILALAARLVRNGGRLIYATCSLLLEENEAQVSGICALHPGFQPLAMEKAWPDAPAQGQSMLLTPMRHGTDGFFASVLERAE